MKEPRDLAGRVFEQIALRPDVARALRATVAFAVPLMVFHWLRRPMEAVFIAMAAQNLSLQDLRGAYGARLTILATMATAMAGSALLGAWSANTVLGASLAMGLIALLSGLWRHLSADYGPALGIGSALLFLLGLSQLGGLPAGPGSAD